MSETVSPDYVSDETLVTWVRNTRKRLDEMVRGLNDEQLMGPYGPFVNPFRWELAHDAWFQEYWILRHLFDEEPALEQVDRFYDSTQIEHEKRWVRDLHPMDTVRSYNREVGERVIHRIQSESLSDRERYYILYSVYHSDMHTEAFTYMRQSLGYPEPPLSVSRGECPSSPALDRNDFVEIPGHTIMLGAAPDQPFAFDNEKWEYEVEVEPFQMARTPVTNGDFLRFVEDNGYRDPSYWSDRGWAWRCSTEALSPLYWRNGSEGNWEVRTFDSREPLDPARPVIHISYWEAEAYCRWADLRLPTEAEWALAASGEPRPVSGRDAVRLTTYPWKNTDEIPSANRASLDWFYGGTTPAGAFPEGESYYGCRDMIGNTWEWTRTTFEPFPGFEPDFYEQYSEPWFGSRKVLRGGAWPTRARVIRNGFRNYYTTDRRDVLAGFRPARDME